MASRPSPGSIPPPATTRNLLGWSIGTPSIALVGRLLAGPLPLNYYDVGYGLIWGREILNGHLPDYRTPGASTPHPLGTLLATLAAAFGTRWSWDVVQAIVFLSLGVVAVALFLLTRAALRSLPAAVLAVAALLLSPPFLSDALGGSGLSDIPALALVLAAAALLAQAPRRWARPLGLLALAGLMRPEAWGLAGAYWLYLLWTRTPTPQLVRAALLVAASPLLWALADVIVVSDPTYSLTHTQAASKTQMFQTGLANVPHAAATDLRALVGLPVLVVGLAGLVLALSLARRRLALPLILLTLAFGEFALLGLAGVPLLERFLSVVAALICLFFAYAVLPARHDLLARVHLPTAPTRLLWSIAAVLVVAYVGLSDLTRIHHVRDDQRAVVAAEADLRSLARQSVPAAAVRGCGPLYVARFELTSLAAYDFDQPPQAILHASAHAPRRRLMLVPATAAAGHYFGVTPPRLALLRRQVATRGFRLLASDPSWRLYARGCPAALARSAR
ncbi:MAG TPA: hypothetical protein VG165_16970 [Solirubrobacteraceae bacterium]|jgi:hypothetical protein|nr:hypothetical protein [Solirubrobacteraceae bacterium]